MMSKLFFTLLGTAVLLRAASSVEGSGAVISKPRPKGQPPVSVATAAPDIPQKPPVHVVDPEAFSRAIKTVNCEYLETEFMWQAEKGQVEALRSPVFMTVLHLASTAALKSALECAKAPLG